MRRRLWILYDGRGCQGAGTEDAAIFESCLGGDKEARAAAGDYGAMAAYSYEIKPDRTGPPNLVDERWEWDWTPGPGFSDTPRRTTR